MNLLSKNCAHIFIVQIKGLEYTWDFKTEKITCDMLQCCYPSYMRNAFVSWSIMSKESLALFVSPSV